MPPARSTTDLKMRSFLGNAMNGLFFAVQQRMRLGDRIDVGTLSNDRTHDTHFDAESNVRLHAECHWLPLFAWCLVRAPLPVLRRRRCCDDRRVQDAVFLEQQ